MRGSRGGHRALQGRGGDVGTPGQPSVRLPGLIPRTQYPSHRSRSEPGDSRGSVLRGDSPPQGALTFFGRTRPLRLSRGGGESGRNGAGATGCRGLRLLDWGSVCGGADPPPPHHTSGGSRDRPLPQAESRRQTQRTERASVGGGGGSVGRRRPPLRGGSHPRTPQTPLRGGPHPGTQPTKLRGGPHPVLSELWQLRVLSRNV